MQLPTLLTIFVLALVQGAAELLPVSSSAHVIIVEKLMRLDPTSPAMTFLLVMLHTGTMFAVLFYFWPRWKKRLKEAGASGFHFVKMLLIATACTGVLGFGLKKLIEKAILGGGSHAEVESLFGNLPLIAASLFAVGLFIVASGTRKTQKAGSRLDSTHSVWIGLIQGLCLPFRGFSRSGATISTALFAGISKEMAEDFSFALAVLLTPPVIVIELHRFLKAMPGTTVVSHSLAWGSIGMIFSFGAGLLALKLLSSWLENGRWKYFGYYCFAASLGVLAVYSLGF